MDKTLIDQVVEILRKCQAVPLPGGHGAYFLELRVSHPKFHPAPDVVHRCYVCLALLGDEFEREHWNRKEWLPHAEVWFDQHCPELAAKFGEMPRWQYLLLAMLYLVEKSEYSRHAVSNIQDCYREARRRIMEMVRLRPRTNSFPAIATSGVGKQIPAPAPHWAAVRSSLQGPEADRVLMLYFMYTLHSQLGVPQPTLDAHYPNRRRFYERIALILESSDVTACGVCALARRIATALRTTAVLNEAGHSCIHTAALAAKLPACFQRANHRSRPAHRALVARRLESDEISQGMILAAHDLATAIADLVIDLLRANPGQSASLRKTDYGYLYSRVRSSEREYQAMEQSHSLPEDDPTLHVACSAAGRPLSLSFAKRLSEGQILDQCNSRLELIKTGARWSQNTNRERCTICRAETARER